MRESFRFYDWDEAAGEVRWMCSFDTTEEDVDDFVAALRRELASTTPAPPARSMVRPTASLPASPRPVA